MCSKHGHISRIVPNSNYQSFYSVYRNKENNTYQQVKQIPYISELGLPYFFIDLIIEIVFVSNTCSLLKHIIKQVM